MRCESATEPENPLNLSQKRLLEITCEIFFSRKISHYWDPEYIGYRKTIAWYSPTELKVCHFFIDFDRYRPSI